MSTPSLLSSPRAAALILALGCACAVPAGAQTTPPTKATKAATTAKAHPKALKKAPVEAPVPDASPAQIKAAELVYYGRYDCEFNQTIDIAHSTKHSGYVDVKQAKLGEWLMKPVLSTTGAVRLEDVKDETLMVQIASKSMLLNVKTGHRLVDDCISPKQRELNEAAKAAKASASAPA